MEHSALHPFDSARFALLGMPPDIFGVRCTSVVMVCTLLLSVALHPDPNPNRLKMLETTRYVQAHFFLLDFELTADVFHNFIKIISLD